ncbi:hypothetical protein GPECTOR_313g3 [Gonium pectorale]|uniref:Uncharacterized protein n=1 Tax=Gonium pectorale TaxID=33097 RepID=A0A150FVR2_GONPE|nr:hypothetical protein GPECTOR_313g3 [Gonium pectorale]|eukprot:KXZ41701.1 hypothetical protein GPECTOR_313g3 [Gonium pectorale]
MDLGVPPPDRAALVSLGPQLAASRAACLFAVLPPAVAPPLWKLLLSQPAALLAAPLEELLPRLVAQADVFGVSVGGLLELALSARLARLLGRPPGELAANLDALAGVVASRLPGAKDPRALAQALARQRPFLLADPHLEHLGQQLALAAALAQGSALPSPSLAALAAAGYPADDASARALVQWLESEAWRAMRR